MNLIDFGQKKGFVGLHTRPVKSKDCVGILLLPLDLGHVLAQLRITKVLFSHSLIDICILVVTTAEARVSVKQLQLESELQGGRVGKHLVYGCRSCHGSACRVGNRSQFYSQLESPHRRGYISPHSIGFGCHHCMVGDLEIELRVTTVPVKGDERLPWFYGTPMEQ